MKYLLALILLLATGYVKGEEEKNWQTMEGTKYASTVESSFNVVINDMGDIEYHWYIIVWGESEMTYSGEIVSYSVEEFRAKYPYYFTKYFKTYLLGNGYKHFVYPSNSMGWQLFGNKFKEDEETVTAYNGLLVGLDNTDFIQRSTASKLLSNEKFANLVLIENNPDLSEEVKVRLDVLKNYFGLLEEQQEKQALLNDEDYLKDCLYNADPDLTKLINDRLVFLSM